MLRGVFPNRSNSNDEPDDYSSETGLDRRDARGARGGGGAAAGGPSHAGAAAGRGLDAGGGRGPDDLPAGRGRDLRAASGRTDPPGSPTTATAGARERAVTRAESLAPPRGRYHKLAE